jgi:hypothetical protein
MAGYSRTELRPAHTTILPQNNRAPLIEANNVEPVLADIDAYHGDQGARNDSTQAALSRR